MISITANFGQQYMANRRDNTDLPNWAVKTVTGVASILLIFSAVTASMLYDGIQDSLKGVNTSITAISINVKAQGESLARIEEKFKYLDHRVELLERPHYESKARAAGFKNPQIVQTNLAAQEKFESHKIKSGAEEHFIQYTLLGYNSKAETLAFRVDEIIRSEDGKERLGNIQGNIHAIHVKPGELVEFPILFDRHKSRVVVQILDLPSPNRAILAIGEKTNPDGKVS